jgi:hypothetical protein
MDLKHEPKVKVPVRRDESSEQYDVCYRYVYDIHEITV